MEGEAGDDVEAVKSSEVESAKPAEEADKAFDSVILTGVGTSDESSEDK